MNVSFYFDPACPFCWVTSRWLLMASNKREINISWHLFSLAVKNGEFDPGKNKSDFDHMPSHRVERVILAGADSGASMLDMYTAFGIKHFLAGDEYDDEVIMSVLKQLNLDESLIARTNDESLDERLIESTQEAVDIVGQDIGVPTIVFDTQDGKKTGFFGPVIQTLPEQDEAVELWDGIVKLVNNPNFYELKRGRPSGGPDVISTAKC